MGVLASVSAGCIGYVVSSAYVRWSTARKRKRQAKGGLLGSWADGLAGLECGGVSAWEIGLACRESIKPTFGSVRRRASALSGKRAERFDALALRAGLGSTLTRAGFDSARLCLALLYFGVGLVGGSVFSLELAVLLGFGCSVAGWLALGSALRKEAGLRSGRLGSQLGEMAEVVALGLRSGLSFDRALALYCTHFDSGFARDCERARQRWTLGLVSREKALRALADSYDSAMLSRIVENVVRSLRFGTSLAETLESAAVEARSVHKAEVEERVAKAPVKMLIPVGTLILPAMLIFVLGPIMLDLMEGM